MPEPYLAGLRLAGRRVVVVGGGQVAQRRVAALVDAGAAVELISPETGPTVQGLAESGALTWTARPYRPGDLDGAWYVLACTDDPDTNAAVAAEAESARVFCVRADDASAGSAVTPATLSSGPVTLGVLAGGDPGLARAVRSALRAWVEERPPGVREGSRRPAVPGVALVGGGPGEADLITVRGRRLLAEADVVVADRLAPQGLLADLDDDVEVVDVAKLPRGRFVPQEEINRILVERALAGRFVVRLKGGDPFVYGRGWEELEACAAAGVPVTVVPGISSAIAVPGLAGIPVTHRDLTQEFTVVTGHLDPDDERSRVDWPVLARLTGTLVVLMGVQRLERIAEVLIREGRDPATPAAVVADGSLPGQRRVSATLDRIAVVAAEAGIGAPAVAIVGDVAALGG